MSQQDKLSVKIALILALLIYGLSLLYLASFLHLSQVNGATVMVLVTFVASVLLWIFVATDWSSLLAILALGLIPQVGLLRQPVCLWAVPPLLFFSSPLL